MMCTYLGNVLYSLVVCVDLCLTLLVLLQLVLQVSRVLVTAIIGYLQLLLDPTLGLQGTRNYLETHIRRYHIVSCWYRESPFTDHRPFVVIIAH